MRALITSSILAVFASQAAWAQSTGNPATMSPETPGAREGTPSKDHGNAVDQLFAKQAAMGGKAEVAAGNLAKSRTSNEQVKQFAAMMVGDHSKANEQLAQIAQSKKITLPDKPDAEHEAKLAELQKLQGADFDRAYLTAQIADHQKTAQLLQHEIDSGQDQQLQSFAKEILPTVLQHLEAAKQLQAQLSQGVNDPKQPTK